MDMNFRLETSPKDLVLLSTNQGRSVLVPTAEDDYSQLAKPTFIYMQNVMPKSDAYSSVGYRPLGGQTNYPLVMAQVSTIRTCDERVYPMLNTPDNNFMFVNGAWTNIGGYTSDTTVTVATIHKVTYVCHAYTTIQQLNPTYETLDVSVILALDVTKILGITNANNHLIAYTIDTIHYSNQLDSLDFTPSLATRAGSIMPLHVRGAIVCCLPYSNGFMIFTTLNMVRATFSGNVDQPFTYMEVSNSGGINKPRDVTTCDNFTDFFAWTTKGLQKIIKVDGEAQQVYPDVTDFLVGRILEVYIGETGKMQPSNVSRVWASETQHWKDFDVGYNELKQLRLDKSMVVRPTMIGARWLVISYGQDLGDFIYSHALVYDKVLDRWGRLVFDHMECFELADATQANNLRETNHQIAFIDKQMGVWTLDMEGLKGSGTNTEVYQQGVVMIGKLQHSRGKVTTMQSIEIENILPESSTLSILTSLDGKNFNPAIYPKQTIATKNLGKWYSRTTGLSHVIKLTGTFELVSLTGTVTVGGGR